MKGGDKLAFNPRLEQSRISYAAIPEARAREEVDKQNVQLKPLPHIQSKPQTKVEYYIEIWKKGCDPNDKIATILTTANIKYVISLILEAGHHVVYLMRLSDKKVIWNKQ